MKRIFSIIAIIFIFLITMSCTNVTNNDVMPKEKFTVDSYIENNALFEENSKLVISGTSEPGVVIEALIYDKNERVVSSNKAITLKESNAWEITLNAPKGSFDKYSIVIRDSYKLFEEKYENILFGKLWMFLGNDISYYKDNLPLNDNEELAKEKDYSNLNFLYPNLSSDWIKEDDDHTLIDDFMYNFARRISDTHKMPIGIINITSSDAQIESYLSIDKVNSINKIKDYLQSENKYVETPSKDTDICYLYETFVSKFNYMKFSGVIFNHNNVDTELFTNNKFLNFYFLSYINIIDTLNQNLGGSNVYVLGASSNEDNLIKELRNVQYSATNYFSYAHLIPTFDLNHVVDDEIMEADLDKLVSRIVDSLKQNINFSKYANLVYVTGSDEVVTKIKIEFSNTDMIKILKDDVNKNKTVINYLDIYYNDLDQGIVKLEDVYYIEDNFLVIDLVYETIEDESGNVILNKVYDKEKIIISYGEYGDLTKYNLVNDSNLPIIPFKIILK